MAQRWYDTNGSTAGFGTLTGNWNDAFWSTSSAGTANTSAVTFTNADEALFGFTGTTATAGTVTIPTGLTVTLNKITTANMPDLQTIAAAGTGALTLAGTTPTVSIGSDGGLLISAPIGGTSGLTKTTFGNLTLSGNNTYSGGTSIVTGTVIAASASALGTGTVSISAGYNLVADFSGTLSNAISSSGGGATIRSAASRSVVLTGALACAGTVTVLESLAGSTLTMNSASSITGAGYIYAQGSGAVTINSVVALSGATALYVQNGATVVLTGTNTFTGAIGTGAANAVLATTGSIAPSVAGPFGNSSAAITNNYSNSFIKFQGSSAATWSRTLSLQGVNCGLDASGTTSSATLTVSSAFTLGSNTGIVLKGTNTGANTLSTALPNSSATLGLTKQDAGTWVLTGANTYTGGTTISGGALRGTTTSSFSSGSITISGGGVAEFSGGLTYTNAINLSGGTLRNFSGANTLSGTIILAGANTLDATAGTLSIGAMSGSGGSLTIQNAGSLTLAATNSFTGPCTIASGALTVTNLTPAGSSSTIGAGSSLILSNTGVCSVTDATVTPRRSDRALTFSSTTTGGLANNSSGAYTSVYLYGTVVATSSTINLKGAHTGYNTITGAITGANGIAKSETGTWYLTGANSLTGASSITGGTLMVANSTYGNQLVGGAVTVSASSKLQTSADGTQAGRCTYGSLTFSGGGVGTESRLRIGGSAIDPAIYLGSGYNLTLPTGTDKTTWDLSATVFKSPGTYTLFVFQGSGALLGGTLASNVTITGLAPGRSASLAYDSVSTPKTIKVTIT